MGNKVTISESELNRIIAESISQRINEISWQAAKWAQHQRAYRNGNVVYNKEKSPYYEKYKKQGLLNKIETGNPSSPTKKHILAQKNKEYAEKLYRNALEDVFNDTSLSTKEKMLKANKIRRNYQDIVTQFNQYAKGEHKKVNGSDKLNIKDFMSFFGDKQYANIFGKRTVNNIGNDTESTKAITEFSTEMVQNIFDTYINKCVNKATKIKDIVPKAKIKSVERIKEYLDSALQLFEEIKSNIGDSVKINNSNNKMTQKTRITFIEAITKCLEIVKDIYNNNKVENREFRRPIITCKEKLELCREEFNFLKKTCNIDDYLI